MMREIKPTKAEIMLLELANEKAAGLRASAREISAEACAAVLEAHGDSLAPNEAIALRGDVLVISSRDDDSSPE